MRRAFPRLAADSGRIAVNPDLPVGELRLALFNVPAELPRDWSMLLAVSNRTQGWRRQYVEISYAGGLQTVQTPRRKSVLGEIEAPLDESPDATLEVALHDKDQWLVSCSEADLALGDNKAFAGDEVIAFGEATSLGDGRFRLARLRRAQLGTQASTHAKGEAFALIEQETLQPIVLLNPVAGTVVRASAQTGSNECRAMLAPSPSAQSKRRRAPACPSRRYPAGN